jgi:arginase family enzyme
MGINTTGKSFSQAHKQGSVIMRVSNTSALMCKVFALAGLCSISLFALAQDTSGHVTGTNPYPYNTVDPREEVPEPIELPDDVLPMLESLSPEDIELLKSGRAKKYTGGADGIKENISAFTPDELQAWVDAIRTVLEASVYIEGRDSPNIPLNTESEEFNAWRVLRPRSLDPEREAGPLNLGRYNGFGGPQTFGGFPLALTKEDLIAGEVDVAILGAPLNMGSGWRDSGPRATAELRIHGRGMGSLDQYVLVKGSSVLKIVDYGDVAVDNLSTERSMEHIRSLVREIAETGAVPIIVGGDHSLSYPNIAGIADVYGKEKVSVIHFDSHYDAWWGGAHLISHGLPVYRLLIEGHVRAADYIQMGLRASGPDKVAFKWMREQGMRYHTMAEIERRGWEAVIDRVVTEASEEGRKLFISFDIDVIDPAFTVATGTPVPGGLNMRESISIVRRLCSESNVVGFDLVELHPALDPTYRTTQNSVHIIKACITGLAMRKEGLTDKHYLSPVSSEHAIDDYYGDQKKYIDATAAEVAKEKKKEKEKEEEDKKRSEEEQ